MRTGKVILSGTHFFAYYQPPCFLPTWGLIKMLCVDMLLPYLCFQNEGTNKQDAHSFSSYRLIQTI